MSTYSEIETHHSSFLSSLNPAQQQAVTSESTRLLVLAGAGSGKTRVLVSRIGWQIIQHGVLPTEVLAVTFTNKAAKEMGMRLSEIMGQPTYDLWIGTFHGLAHRFLRMYYEQANLPESFQIIDSDDQQRILKQLIKQAGYDEDSMPAKKVSYFINRQKEEARRYNQCQSKTHEQQILLSVYQRYEQYCFRNGLVDFSELLLRVYELFLAHPEIAKEYQTRFKHILVDEFQDTNTIQYLWLKALVTPHNSLTVVGDDDQSIYGWRGAKVENIQQFSTDYQNAEVVRLEQNYRSQAEILNLANHLISQNSGRLGKHLWTDKQAGEKIKLYGAFSDMDEAKYVVNQIQGLLKLYQPQDIAILYRSNAQSRVLEQVFRQQELPYRIYGGMRFFDRQEIKDAIGYLRLLRHEEDDPAFERVVNTPPRGIGERSVALIRELARNQYCSLFEAAKQLVQTQKPNKAMKQLAAFIAMIEQLQEESKSTPLDALLTRVYELSTITEYYKQQTGEKAQAKLENLEELVMAVEQYQLQATEQSEDLLAQFLSDCALEAGGEENTSEAVQLMTLHAAKGLEFKVVFMVGLEDGLFPSRHSVHDQAKLEEERRLCYVGITRAMERLALSYALRRGFGYNSAPTKLSRFVQEMPSSMLDRVNVMQPGGGESRARHSSVVDNRTVADFRVGQRVGHKKFGEGVILGFDGVGDMARVEVQFQLAGRKLLVMSYANLEAM